MLQTACQMDEGGGGGGTSVDVTGWQAAFKLVSNASLWERER